MGRIAILTKIAVLPGHRTGPRPRTPRSLPHVQLDQLPPAGVMEELLRLSLEMPHVRVRESRMASPGTNALYLAGDYALGPPEAFIDDYEFCHLHPLPEGTIHLTLPALLREEVILRGWGERHPVAGSGVLSALMTIYAPRDAEEFSAVFELITQSWRFATGQLRVLHEDRGDGARRC